MFIYIWLYIYDYIYIWLLIYDYIYMIIYIYDYIYDYIWLYYIWLYRMKSSWVQSRFHPLSTRPCPKRLQLDAVGMEPMEPVGDLFGMPQTSARHAAEVVVLLAMEGLVTWYFFEEPSPGYLLPGVREKSEVQSVKRSECMWCHTTIYYRNLFLQICTYREPSMLPFGLCMYLRRRGDCLAYFELWAVSNNW